MGRRTIAKLASRRLQRLFDAHRFDECVEEFRKLEASRDLLPNELVQKGACLQLGSGETGSLEDVEEAYHRALELDADYVPALLELGWFYYAVQNETEKALSFFNRATELLNEDAREAAEGREKCLNELRDDRIAEVPEK